MSEINRIDTSLLIPAAPSRVWKVLTDFSRWDQWSSLYRGIEWLPLMEVGEHFRFRLALFQQNAQAETAQLERYDPPVRIVWSSQGTLARVKTDISLLENRRDQTKLRHAIELTSRNEAEAVATGLNKEIAARLDHFNQALSEEVRHRSIGN